MQSRLDSLSQKVKNSMPSFLHSHFILCKALWCEVINKRVPVNFMINFSCALCTRLDSGHLRWELQKICGSAEISPQEYWFSISVNYALSYASQIEKNCGQRIFPACHHGHSFGHSIAQCYLPIDKSLQKMILWKIILVLSWQAFGHYLWFIFSAFAKLTQGYACNLMWI